MRELEQPGQAAEVPPPADAQRGLQVSGRPVADDDMRIGVFLPASRAVQVADQPGHVLAARADFPDHRSPVTGHRPGRGGISTLSKTGPAERHPRRSRTGGTASAAFGPRGTPSGHPRSAERRPESVPAVRRRGPEESGPQVFPGRFQPGGAAQALLRVREKVTGPLPGRVKLRDRLVQVHAYPAHPQRGAVQGVHRVPQRLVRHRDRAPRDGQGRFGRVRAARQPGLAGGGRHLGVLLLRQREPHCPATPHLMPGPAARPGTGPACRRREPDHREERTPRAFSLLAAKPGANAP